LRGSEVCELKNADLFRRGAIRITRSWYKGSINPTKTGEIREVGIVLGIFDRLTAWIAGLPDRSNGGWVFPSEQVVTACRKEARAKKLSGIESRLRTFMLI
jgi:hypothetical protein